MNLIGQAETSKQICSVNCQTIIHVPHGFSVFLKLAPKGSECLAGRKPTEHSVWLSGHRPISWFLRIQNKFCPFWSAKCQTTPVFWCRLALPRLKRAKFYGRAESVKKITEYIRDGHGLFKDISKFLLV